MFFFPIIRILTLIIYISHRITHNKDIPTSEGYEQMFPNIRTNAITKRMYLSFTFESIYTFSQLKYDSKHDGTTGIFEILRENLAFVKLKRFHSLTEASIDFFLEIYPKLNLQNVL